MRLKNVLDLGKRAKVAITQRNMTSIRSGVPKQVLNEIDLLEGFNNEILLICEKADASLLQNSNVKIIPISLPYYSRLLSRAKRRAMFCARAERAIQQLDPDLVVGHGDIVHQDLCFLHNCIHLAAELMPNSTINDAAAMHAEILRAQSFKLLIANSQLMRQDFIDRFGLSPRQIKVIYPSYDSERFYVEHATDKSFKSSIGLPEEPLVVGLITSGNFLKRNLDVLLEAFAYGKSRGISGVFLLVAGSDKSKRYRQRVRDLGLEDRVLFAPSINAVQQYYQILDVFVLPAHIEEFGRSALEAAACGKPVICSDKVGATELLPQAMVMPASTPQAWWEAIEKVLRDANYARCAREQAPELRLYDNAASRNTLMTTLESLQ